MFHLFSGTKSSVDFPEVVLQENSDEIIIDDDNEKARSVASSMFGGKDDNEDDTVFYRDSSDQAPSVSNESIHEAKRRRKTTNHPCFPYTDQSYCNMPASSSNAHLHATLNLSSVDEDDLFCLSVSSTLKRLSLQEKSLAKLHILQVLHEIQFQGTLSGMKRVRSSNRLEKGMHGEDDAERSLLRSALCTPQYSSSDSAQCIVPSSEPPAS